MSNPFKILRLNKKIIGGGNDFGVYDVYKVEKEYDDYDKMLIDVYKYRDKIGKEYIAVEELVVTDDLKIEPIEVNETGLEEIPEAELEQMYNDLMNRIF